MAVEYQLSYTAREIDNRLGSIDKAVFFTEQNLTEAQKAQARKNIGITSTNQSGSNQNNSSQNDIVLNRNGVGRSYQYDYMREIANIANKHTKSNALTFLWVTDTHTTLNDFGFIGSSPYIGSVCAQMTKYVPCEFVAHTGDIIDGTSFVDDELSLLSELNRNFMDSSCPVFYVKGNHDDNRIYALSKGGDGYGSGEDYILDSELYARTNAFHKNVRTPVGNNKMYFYYDDEHTKVRSIFLNSYDFTEECDEAGNRTENPSVKIFSQEQLDWLRDDALNFTEKEMPSEWGVILFSHLYLHNDVYRILGNFQNGIDVFEGRGNGEIIAQFVGDDHLDMLSYFQFTYTDYAATRITGLNASKGRDNTEDATTDNSVLYPPAKVKETENETAFDLVTIDRENKLIYLTRYGARSLVYNDETGEFDLLAARTRIIDYTTGTYVKLTDGVLAPDDDTSGEDSGGDNTGGDNSGNDQKIEATNVLMGIIFESGYIGAGGVDADNSAHIRSAALDISSLQATTDTARQYRYVAYSGDAAISNMAVYFYDDDGYVAGADGNANSNTTYGFPDNALSALHNYNRYTSIKYMRWTINSTLNKITRIAIYEIVDGAAVLIDECDIGNVSA